MTEILISYARRDRDIAARLAASLAARGFKAAWDVSELPDGDLLRAARQRLHAAQVIIVLWSKASAAAPWVLEEANLAIGRDALVSASIDGTLSPVATKHPTVDLAGWANTGLQAGLDPLIASIAEAAKTSQPGPAPEPAPAASAPIAPPTDEIAPPPSSAAASAPGAQESPAEVNKEPPSGETAATAAFIIIAFLALLGAAVARQQSRTPADLPPVSMDAEEPFDVPVIVPTPEEENAPSGLRPVPKPQDSTGSVKK